MAKLDLSPQRNATHFLLKVCLLVLLLGLSQPNLAHASRNSSAAVILSAPEEVEEVLKLHFVLPEALLKSENERTVFMHRAQREIPELLATEGYFSSKVVLNSVTPEGVLELEVIPGALTLVTEARIEFRGELALPDAGHSARLQPLRESWQLPPGSAFRALAWDEAKTDLLARVARYDYAAARMIESSAQVDAVNATARLHVMIDSGPRFLFGDLQISGLERYEEFLVRRYATFHRDQPYQRDLLMLFQAQLQNLPQFSSVIVNLDTPPIFTSEEANQGTVTAPINVQIVEALSRKFALGVGYSTNNGVRNEANYQSYNFLNQAWTLNSAVVLEQNRQTASLGLDTPPNPRGYYLAWKGSGEKTQIQGLDTRRDKFGVTRSRTQFGIDAGTGVHWQQEQRLPQGGIKETDQALVLDWHWIRRTVDNPLFPMSGALTELRIGGASKSLLSDQDFIRNYFRYQVWLAIGANDVVTPRVELGYTAATTRLGIPQEYLFRVGGTQTVRGFAYQSLGFQEGAAIVGGRAMATTSVEYTHWFGNWGAALFTDAGGAADITPELRLSVGYGVGARWRSPVGPLALDYARGKGQPDARLHFSIAVAF